MRNQSTGKSRLVKAFRERLRVEVTSGCSPRKDVVRPRMRRNCSDFGEQYAHQRQDDDAEGFPVFHHLGRHLNDVVLDPAFADADVLAGT